MTDTSILPTADTGAALPGAPAGGIDDEGGGDDRRKLLIIGGVVGVILIAAVAFLLLHGGGSSSGSTSGLVAHGTPKAVASPPPGSSAGGTSDGGNSSPAGVANGGSKAGTTLPKKSHTRLARDPFKPLIAAGSGDAAAAPGTTTGSTTAVNPAPGTAPGTVPTSPAQGGAPSGANGTPVSIRLISLHGDQSATFDVTYRHGKTFRFEVVAPSANSASGTVFAQDFSLLGIQGNEATIQIGDDTPFDLRRGASHPV